MKKFFSVLLLLLEIPLLLLSATLLANNAYLFVKYRPLISAINAGDTEAAVTTLMEREEVRGQLLQWDYDIAVEALQEYMKQGSCSLPDGSLASPDEIVWQRYTGLAAQEKLLDTFSALGDYGQAAEICARFHRFSDVATQVTNTHYNRFDETGLSQTWHYEYDSSGRRTRIAHEDNSAYYVLYDESGNPIERHDGYDWTYVYDEQGRLVMKDGIDEDLGFLVTTHYRYDESGRLLEETKDVPRSHSFTMRYTYDDQGRIASKWESAGYWNQDITWLYQYDDAGRLTAIVPEDYQQLLGYAPIPVTTFSYDEAGRLCAEKFFYFLELDGQGGYMPYEGSESVESYYHYDAQGRLVRQEDREDGARDVIEYTYGDYLLFDAEGLDLE